MSDVLSALDATFLELEQQNEGALMHIGGVMVFDPVADRRTPSYTQVRDGIAARLEQLPRYTQRLSEPRAGGLAWPRWVTAERFDIANHLSRVALPAPGGPSELCAWSSDFFSHRLDRTRPLWEMALIEGLDGGRWALAHKTHHCLVDGVGSVQVAHLLLDPEPDAAGAFRSVVPPPASIAELLRERLPGAVQPIVQAAQAGARATAMGVQSLRHPREALARSTALAELLIRDELLASPPSSLNVPIGSTRRFAVVNVPLAELKAIRRKLGGTVNDAALAACAAGLRRLLIARGETPPRGGLRAMVPTDLRTTAEHLALGNRISSLFLELPVAEPSARARYHAIVDRSQRLKRSHAAQGAGMMLELAALAPPVLHATLARSLYARRLFNVTITNVPGPQAALYALGARLREVHPVVPLAADHAVGIAIFSYDGLVTFGVIADAESTPDIGELALGIADGVQELLSLARGLEPVL